MLLQGCLRQPKAGPPTPSFRALSLSDVEVLSRLPPRPGAPHAAGSVGPEHGQKPLAARAGDCPRVTFPCSTPLVLGFSAEFLKTVPRPVWHRMALSLGSPVPKKMAPNLNHRKMKFSPPWARGQYPACVWGLAGAELLDLSPGEQAGQFPIDTIIGGLFGSAWRNPEPCSCHQAGLITV